MGFSKMKLKIRPHFLNHGFVIPIQNPAPITYIFLSPKVSVVSTRCGEYGAHAFDLDAVATGSVGGMTLYIPDTDKENLGQNHYTHH